MLQVLFDGLKLRCGPGHSFSPYVPKLNHCFRDGGPGNVFLSSQSMAFPLRPPCVLSCGERVGSLTVDDLKCQREYDARPPRAAPPYPAGESDKGAVRLDFHRRLKMEFQLE